MPARPDLLILGDANPDLVLRGDVVPRFGQAEQLLTEATLTLGGSAAITAHVAAKLGARVGLIAVVGRDLFGDFTLDTLEAVGVDISRVCRVDASTGLSVILSRPDTRAILTHTGAIERLTAEQIDLDDVADARHVHASSYYLQPGLAAALPSVFGHARRHGVATSLDTNADPAGAWSGMDSLLSLVDTLLPNRGELLGIASAVADGAFSDVEEAAATLARRGPLVVVKDGAEGAFAVGADAQLRVAAEQVDVVDTTGAGDTFNATFIVARLAGCSVDDSVRQAVRAASRSTTYTGGVETARR